MTALIIHGTAAKIVIVAIYLGFAAVLIGAVLVARDAAQEWLEKRYEQKIHEEFRKDSGA
jgi:hypothetical protein